MEELGVLQSGKGMKKELHLLGELFDVYSVENNLRLIMFSLPRSIFFVRLFYGYMQLVIIQLLFSYFL